MAIRYAGDAGRWGRDGGRTEAMLVVFPVCTKDFDLARSQLRWLVELGGHGAHQALILASANLDDAKARELYQLVKNAGFGTTHVIRQRDQDADRRGWPAGPNDMFKTAVEWVRGNARCPWFWCEPDAVPQSKGWVDALDAGYKQGGKPYMGTLGPETGGAGRHLTGTAVYPPDVLAYNRNSVRANLRPILQPFDTVDPHLTLAVAHLTNLIQHVWSDTPPDGPPWTFPTKASLHRICPEAVVFHRCKDGTLIERLRERRREPAVILKPPPGPIKQKPLAAVKIKGLLGVGSSYYHSGNLGDIIYGLQAVKHNGGGALFIGPEQRDTSPCGMPITESQFKFIAPLLNAQPYIKSTTFCPTYPNGQFKYDLNSFRNNWDNGKLRHEQNIHNLCEMHCYTLGLRAFFNEQEPWLLPGGKPIVTNRLIIHRSTRYQSKDFPWAELVRRHAHRMLFVGFSEEHADFQKIFNAKVSFWGVTDMLEMARLIAGSVAFVGNQSAPCAVALAIGQRVYQESWYPKSPDCIFRRESFLNQLDPVSAFEKWL